MWLDNLKELKEKSGMTLKQIADKSHLPERTVVRIFAGESDHPYADTLDLISKAMGYDLGDVFSETKVVIAAPELIEIKENVTLCKSRMTCSNQRLPLSLPKSSFLKRNCNIKRSFLQFITIIRKLRLEGNDATTNKLRRRNQAIRQ